MKRKILMVGLVLALALTVVMPATAMAAKPPATLIATGAITDITPGEVKPAGNSGRWVVKDRDIEFTFAGALNGDYTLTYHANVVVDVEGENLQAGNLQGILVSDDIIDDTALNVRGRMSPAQFITSLDDQPIYPGGPSISVALYVIHIEGRWTFISGRPGNGSFEGDIYVVICVDDDDWGIPIIGYDLDGHVLGVGGGLITLYD